MVLVFDQTVIFFDIIRIWYLLPKDLPSSKLISLTSTSPGWAENILTWLGKIKKELSFFFPPFPVFFHLSQTYTPFSVFHIAYHLWPAGQTARP